MDEIKKFIAEQRKKMEARGQDPNNLRPVVYQTNDDIKKIEKVARELGTDVAEAGKAGHR